MKVAVSQSINCAHKPKVGALHGHTYRITVVQSGPVEDDGMVLPIEFLAHRLHTVLKQIDHQPLEQFIDPPATAERLAQWIKDQLMTNVTVRVQIGDDGWVETE